MFSKSLFFVTCWEISLSQSHSTANLLHLSLFWKIGFFSKKTYPFITEKNTFRKFREFLHFQWPCSVTLLLLAILKKSTNFSITQSVFFSKKDQFLNVLRNPTKSVAFCIKLAAFSRLQKNSKFFFRKTSLFLSRRSHFFNVLRDLTNWVASYNKLFIFSGF